MQSRNELTEVVAPRYQKATKAEKGVILSEYCSNTGFHRKYAIRKLTLERHYPYEERKKEKKKRNKPSRYTIIRAPLKYLWETADYPCGSRLKEMLPDYLSKTKQFDEIPLLAEQIEKMIEVSPATIDRILAKEIRLKRKKTNSQTRKGNPYSLIPFAIDCEKVNCPGMLEIDLVAHCGGVGMGTFVNTLSTTDFLTGWQESEAILGKNKEAVRSALIEIEKRLPFPLKGIDFDSGSEFVNDVIYKFCQEMRIAISKSRPYKKNDNAHIEQKNWTNVRRIIGYLRFDTEEARELLNDLYRNELRLYINFFQPSVQLIRKERTGSKVKRIYDKAKTPYRRIMEREDISQDVKERLTRIYADLNPFELKRTIDQKLQLLIQLAGKAAA